jgi:hypothetical protein
MIVAPEQLPPLTEESAAWQELNARYGPAHRARIIEDAVNQLDTRQLRAIYRQVGSLDYSYWLKISSTDIDSYASVNAPKSAKNKAGRSPSQGYSR